MIIKHHPNDYHHDQQTGAKKRRRNEILKVLLFVAPLSLPGDLTHLVLELLLHGDLADLLLHLAHGATGGRGGHRARQLQGSLRRNKFI